MYDDSAARGAWRAYLVRYSVVYFMPSEDRTWRGKILFRRRKITSCRKDSEPMRSKGGTISSAVQCGRLTWESCSRCF